MAVQRRGLLLIAAISLATVAAVAGAWTYQQKKEAADYESNYQAAIHMNDMLRAADKLNGKLISQGCLMCHSFEKGDTTKKVGPNLFGIVGRGIAAERGYDYSFAFQALKGKRTWTTDELDGWLHGPADYIPGTRMTFGGLTDPQDRMDLIAYLITLH